MMYFIYYLSTLIVMTAIDFVWLTVANTRLYRPTLGDMLLDKPRIAAAVVFYLLYAAGVTIFVGLPTIKSSTWTMPLMFGALFGVFCYATYDLTNQATLRNWSTQLTLIDISWGAILTGVAATAAYFITRAIVKV